MSGRRQGLLASAIPLLLCSLPFLLPSDGSAQESCQSAQCHATLVQGSAVHEAAESCDTCHEATATPHPQKGTATFKLTDAEPALCTGCHDALAGKAHVHAPFADGSCTTCHSPHASNTAGLLLKPQKELCVDCHSEPGAAKFPHGPVEAGDCTACHAPHASDNKALLARTGDALCVDCHSDVSDLVAAKKVKHAALDDGCTSCHQAHGGEHPKLLAEAGQALCFQCHDDIAEKVQKSPVVHAALAAAKGCASCHSPHAADEKGLLLETEKDGCLGCHKEVVTAAMTVLHGPIRDGSCTGCHEPHGGQETKLLVESFPATAYVPYTDTAYALCFTCHERDLLKYPDTSFATGFRDGERNLHFLHVNNAQKGRSCVLCHNLHGGTNDALIAESVTFGSWKLPLKFVPSENGGSCAPGCHRPATYDRKAPGKKP
ncbi:MAG: cytochrome C [Thermoanaerobaculia bacterium]|nr:cytochrome C [Thermoanaerobaculia bacterium]